MHNIRPGIQICHADPLNLVRKIPKCFFSWSIWQKHPFNVLKHTKMIFARNDGGVVYPCFKYYFVSAISKMLVKLKPWHWWRMMRGLLLPRTKMTRIRIRAYFDRSFRLHHFRFGEVLFRLFWVSAFRTVYRQKVQVVVLLAAGILHVDFWTRPVKSFKISHWIYYYKNIVTYTIYFLLNLKYY